MARQGPLWQGFSQCRHQRVYSGEKPYSWDQCGKICSLRLLKIQFKSKLLMFGSFRKLKSSAFLWFHQIFLYITQWFIRVALSEQILPYWSHEYGFSPECTLWCLHWLEPCHKGPCLTIKGLALLWRVACGQDDLSVCVHVYACVCVCMCLFVCLHLGPVLVIDYRPGASWPPRSVLHPVGDWDLDFYKGVCH